MHFLNASNVHGKAEICVGFFHCLHATIGHAFKMEHLCEMINLIPNGQMRNALKFAYFGLLSHLNCFRYTH